MTVEVTHTDKIGSILWLLLAVGVFIASADLPTGTGETGAAFYPRVLATLIAAFACLQLVKSVYADEVNQHEITATQVKHVGVIAVLITGYVLSLPWLGFVTGTFSFLVIGMSYSGVRSAIRIAGVAIGISLVLYYVFAVLLRIPLPESPFIPIEGLLPGFISSVLGHGVIG